ncbi:MAG: hypothetical protein BroJett011_43400 [Chloroflexota bacterium]|nr:MAG: hypothetical protein BroJett011_43400 [Chloroflexota bacterium]
MAAGRWGRERQGLGRGEAGRRGGGEAKGWAVELVEVRESGLRQQQWG